MFKTLSSQNNKITLLISRNEILKLVIFMKRG